VSAGRGVSLARRIAPGAVPQVLSAQLATGGAARRA
jgi:hypothetical protein